MGGKKKYIEMFGSFTEPFNCCQYKQCLELEAWACACVCERFAQSN